MTAVTVLVPVFRGEAFVADALRSIAVQTHREIEVLVSVDGPSPADEAACRPFAADPRFRIVTQPERLGWVAHASWLLAQVRTPYGMLVGHDDRLDPRCLEVLADVAERHPDAALVHPDIRGFGELEATWRQPSVTGTPAVRQGQLLLDHLAAVGFHGLARADALRAAGPLPSDGTGPEAGFGADTAWMAAMATAGELIRVPEALYLKRYHADSTHRRWRDWSRDTLVTAWATHCAVMLEQAARVPAAPAERRLLWLAAVTRLTEPRLAENFLPMLSFDRADRRELLDAFLAAVGGRPLDLQAWLDVPVRRARRWARSHVRAATG